MMINSHIISLINQAKICGLRTDAPGCGPMRPARYAGARHKKTRTAFGRSVFGLLLITQVLVAFLAAHRRFLV